MARRAIGSSRSGPAVGAPVWHSRLRDVGGRHIEDAPDLWPTVAGVVGEGPRGFWRVFLRRPSGRGGALGAVYAQAWIFLDRDPDGQHPYWNADRLLPLARESAVR